jgi:hypothetical protein
MERLIILVAGAAMCYGIGYWVGWWKWHKLGLVVEKDLSNRLAQAEEEVHRLRCEMSGMDAATEVFVNLMCPEEDTDAQGR